MAARAPVVVQDSPPPLPPGTRVREPQWTFEPQLIPVKAPEPTTAVEAPELVAAASERTEAPRLQVPLPAPRPATEPYYTQASLRDVLDQAQRQRSDRAYRIVLQALTPLGDLLRPALASGAARTGLIIGVVGLGLLVMARFGGGALRGSIRSLAHPISQRSHFLLEDRLRSQGQAWTGSGLAARPDEGVAEVNEGMTLFLPSLNRTDYECTFSGLIRQGALNWVARAADSKNYYAFKLTWRGKGKERRGALVRYAVVDGVEGEAHVAALPFDLDESKTYNIRLTVYGDRITTIINDRGVDSFSDSRLKTGGVGFFAQKGETALIHSLSLSGNNDATGRTISWVRGFYLFVESKILGS